VFTGRASETPGGFASSLPDDARDTPVSEEPTLVKPLLLLGCLLLLFQR